MKSYDGNYQVTIRKCANGTYNSEIFVLYEDGSRMGVGGCHGISSLQQAREMASEWMFKCQLWNGFMSVRDTGDRLARAVQKTLGSDLNKIAKARGVDGAQVIDDAVAFLRERRREDKARAAIGRRENKAKSRKSAPAGRKTAKRKHKAAMLRRLSRISDSGAVV